MGMRNRMKMRTNVDTIKFRKGIRRILDTYLKQQEEINFATNNTPEIDETLHQELITTAIELAIKAINTNKELK